MSPCEHVSIRPHCGHYAGWLPALEESNRSTKTPASAGHASHVWLHRASLFGGHRRRCSAPCAQFHRCARPQGNYLHIQDVVPSRAEFPLPTLGARLDAMLDEVIAGRGFAILRCPALPASPKRLEMAGTRRRGARQTALELCLHGTALHFYAVVLAVSLHGTLAWRHGARSRRGRCAEHGRARWRRGLPVERYTRAQILIAYWGISLYWGAHGPGPGARRARRPHAAAFHSSQAGRPQAGATGV